MDSFEVNKIVGAVLGTLLFVMGIGFIAEAIYAPREGAGPGYALPEPDGAVITAVADVDETPLPVLLANASVDDGARVARKCASCHNFGEGEGNKTGPHLFGVVGRPIASIEDFSYSDSLHELAAEQGDWSYEALNGFLTNPKKYAPGTKMGFSGLRSEQDRADILAYLQSLSNDPVPFPEVEQAPAEEPAAEGEASTMDDGAAADDAAASDDAPATEADMPAEDAAPATDAETAPADTNAAPADETAAPAEEDAPAADAAPAEQTTEEAAPSE